VFSWKVYRASTTCPTVGETTPTGTVLTPTAGWSSEIDTGGSGSRLSPIELKFVDTATNAGTTNYCVTAQRTAGSSQWTLNSYLATVVEYQ
jgi:hypothetical protein